ncbi:hypothetical protein RFI_27942, partial [Reticulomyxa filosa]
QWLCIGADLSANYQLKSTVKKHGGLRIPGIGVMEEGMDCEEDIQAIANVAHECVPNNVIRVNVNANANANANANMIAAIYPHEDFGRLSSAAVEVAPFPRPRKEEIRGKVQRLYASDNDMDELNDKEEEEEEENKEEEGYCDQKDVDRHSKLASAKEKEQQVGELRPRLRVCLLLYNSEDFKCEEIDDKVRLWNHKCFVYKLIILYIYICSFACYYFDHLSDHMCNTLDHLRSMFAIEMRHTRNQQPVDAVPESFLACFFYDNSGIIFGQDTIFDAIGEAIFSP